MKEAQVRFEQYLKRRFGQSSTLKHYHSDLNIFIQSIGPKAPEVVKPQDIDAFVDQQIAAGLSPTTINRRLSSLHTFFEYLAVKSWPRTGPTLSSCVATGSRLAHVYHVMFLTMMSPICSQPSVTSVTKLSLG